MKNHARSLSHLASPLVLTLTLICGIAAAQSTPASGSFGFLINTSYSDPANEYGFAILGVMNLDAAGKVSGSYTSEAGPGSKQGSQPITGTLTGTYSGNPDGTGSLTITIDTGTAFTFATAITDSGQGLQLLATSCSGGCEIGGTSTINGIARAAYSGPLKGTYGYQFNSSPQPGGSIGVLSFDGAGNVATSLTFVGLGSSGQPSIFTGTSTGTYSINTDGSGTLNFPPTPGQGAGQTNALVITDGGSGLLVMQTNRSGNGVSSGIARLQWGSSDARLTAQVHIHAGVAGTNLEIALAFQHLER